MKRMFSLMLCLAMALSLMSVPASACTADENGNVTPCDKVEKDGYCDMPTLTYLVLTGDDKGLYKIDNPYYGRPVNKDDDTPSGAHGSSVELPESIITPEEDQGKGIATDTSPSPEPVQYFDDVPADAWYADAVNTMVASGIIKGFDDGLFHPNDYVTTGQLATIIYRIAKNEDPSGKPVEGYDHWAAYAIDALRGTSLSYTTANPNLAEDTANRGEAIRAIMALIEDAGVESRYTRVFNYTESNNNISDWNIIADYTNQPSGHNWVPLHILEAYNYGIIHGKDASGLFDPLGGLTRAELCQMLANAGLTQYTPASLHKPGGYVLG